MLWTRAVTTLWTLVVLWLRCERGGAVQEADFSHNKVVSIGKSRFKRARKLMHLNLAHNHLSALLGQSPFSIPTVSIFYF